MSPLRISQIDMGRSLKGPTWRELLLTTSVLEVTAMRADLTRSEKLSKDTESMREHQLMG